MKRLVFLLLIMLWPSAVSAYPPGVCGCCTGTPPPAYVDPVPTVYMQQLVELFNRKGHSYPKPADSLFTGGYWQSERVVFTDSLYGSEIWLLAHDPDFTRHNNGINKTPWNANGSLLALMSHRTEPGHSAPEASGDWFIMSADGDSLRRIHSTKYSIGADSVDVIPPYNRIAAWDRVHPSYQYFGYFNGLYGVDWANGDSMWREQPLPNASIRKEIDSYLSETNKVMVNDRYGVNVYMIDLEKAPGASGRYTTYPITFNITGVAGHSAANEATNNYHDDGNTFMRGPDDWWNLTYEGESVMFNIPYSGNADSITVACSRVDSPDLLPYYSHPFWGLNNKVVYYDPDGFDGGNYGLILRNNLTKTFIDTLALWPYAGGGHNAWDGYDTTLAFSAVAYGYTWGGQLIAARTDGTSNRLTTTPFADAVFALNGPDDLADYSVFPRPAQSPDATKCFFVSSMLQPTDNVADSYVAVYRHPDSPKTLCIYAPVSGDSVYLAWDPPPMHKEIAKYHVWRSVADTSHFVPMDAAGITDTTYADTVSATKVYYYGVTAEEYSGLESDTLSNILKVTAATGDTLDFQHEGRVHFDMTAPAPPTSVVVTAKGTNLNRLTWVAPTDKDVSYFNIYYSIGGTPTASQKRRIASPPIGTGTFLDWQADGTHTDYYGITAVDRQGNESAVGHQ